MAAPTPARDPALMMMRFGRTFVWAVVALLVVTMVATLVLEGV